jgi:protocatechuate 3,4-dioxygenase beta subunit
MARLRRGLWASAVALLVVGFGAASADGPGQSALRVRVLGPDGRPTEAAYLNLWRAIDPAAKHPPRGKGLYEPVYWDERSTGRTWERCRNWSPHYPKPEVLGFEELPPGEYRISVANYDHSPTPDPTPFGVSDPVRLGERDRKEVTVWLVGDTPLTVRIVEIGSDAPLEGVAVRLVRADGLPVAHGHGSGNFFERTGEHGEVRFRKLVPGEYALHVLGRWAFSYGDLVFEPLERPVPISVEAGKDNRAELPLRGRPLSQAEIDLGWPFVVTGTVTDAAGRPMPGVEITGTCAFLSQASENRVTCGPDGRYTVRFHAVGHVRGSFQEFASVSAHRPGFYERDLGHSGQFLATSPAPAGPFPRPDPARKVLLANTPYTLNFVMLPAAVVKGRLVDAEGRPLTGWRVSVAGEHGPPPYKVVASAETDRDGQFRFDNVPPGPWWFTAYQGSGNENKSESVTFERPEQYTMELLATDGPKGRRLEARITTNR